MVVRRYKQCSDNGEEGIMLFARIWNDKRMCFFTVYKQVSRLCCRAAMVAMRLRFCLLSLIFFLTRLSWHWDVILPGWLLTLESTSFVHSHRTNSAFCVLRRHFPFVILPSKGILVSDATWLALPLHLFCLKLLFFTLVMH